jgi:hypothetical protein
MFSKTDFVTDEKDRRAKRATIKDSMRVLK